MKQRLLILFSFCALLHVLVVPVAAQPICEGASATALFNGVPWSASCVGVTTSCNDSCVQISGGWHSSEDYAGIVITFPSQPQPGIYPLGGVDSPYALVFGGHGLIWTTGLPPYTGSVEVAVYDPVNSATECRFSFLARELYGVAPDVEVTNGIFMLRRVAVQPSTWSAIKQVYR